MSNENDGDGSETVLVQHRVFFPDTRTWSEWRNGDKPLYNNEFEIRSLYLRPATVVDVKHDKQRIDLALFHAEAAILSSDPYRHIRSAIKALKSETSDGEGK